MARIPWLDLLPWLLFAMPAGYAAWHGAPWTLVALIGSLCVVPTGYILLKAWLDERARRTGGPPSMLEDWTVLGVCLFFCGGALFTLDANLEESLPMLALFGGGVALFVDIIRRKLRSRRFRALSVSVRGGHNIPMSMPRFIAIAAGLLVFGGGSLFAGPPVIAAIGGFVVLVALAILALWAGGQFRQYLRFDPAGLTYGMPRYEYQVPWNAIAGVRVLAISNNAMLVLSVPDLSAVGVTPPRFAAKVRRTILRRGFVIAPLNFGLDTEPLLAALARYVNEPAARAELAPRPEAPARLPAPSA